MRRVGEILRDRGLVSDRDLQDALALQNGGSVGPALVRLGAVSEDALQAALADAFGLPLITPPQMPAVEAVRAAAERLGAPLDWLLEKEVAPWFAPDPDGERLCVAGRQVYDPAVQEAAEQWHEAPARFYLATGRTLEPLFGELGAQAAASAGPDTTRLRELAEEAPVIDFVNAMLAEAIARRASDVHVEPFEDRTLVRLRVDGVLTEWRAAPRALFDAVASRVKLLSGMDIAERRLPQDGRQSIRVGGGEYDVRVSALPTTWGESIVLRFLGKTRDLPTLDELGVAADHARLLTQMIERPGGIVLVAGPTGSGKTTTCYRLITHLNDGVRKIVTVEDPVELDCAGVLQMHVRADIGLGFAAGLRSILRQDPDVIMVGEIRDAETARIAVQAALTGHLVISTLHTGSALGAVSRLLDLGVEEYLLAEVLRGLVGQRLLRRLCNACASPHAGEAEETHARAWLPEALLSEPARWREPVGCAACGHAGFRGRIGVFEVAEVDAALQAAVRRRASEAELEALARPRGFRTLREDALVKARRGETALSEALRVVGAEGAR
ncbi:GspE/PulE family protein [Caulobacter sp. 17J65-9]|uniref:GspE/PulE family protein n=1 Tax=Caulobacter sp. 17J65-9 TaxID=2709382 RepID=UPI0013C67D85|nr:GspE/PulE family protein [Caulobacter sp. 17J65-9]NEX94885.1 type II/IV secretion system protein [Caulobacter sp. 17J65-9]